MDNPLVVLTELDVLTDRDLVSRPGEVKNDLRLGTSRYFWKPLVPWFILWRGSARLSTHFEAAVAKLGGLVIGTVQWRILVFGGYRYCHEHDVERIFRDDILVRIDGRRSDIQKDYFPAYVRI